MIMCSFGLSICSSDPISRSIESGLRARFPFGGSAFLRSVFCGNRMSPSLLEGGGGTIWLTLLIIWWIRLFVNVFVLESVFKDWTIRVVCWRYRYRREAIGGYLVLVYQCSDCLDQKHLELDTCRLL